MMLDPLDSRLEGVHELGQEGVVPVKFLTGAAGTGKTYRIRQEIAANKHFGLLAATTGIAAVNLGAITLNSLLGYYDTSSLEESFFNGWLLKKLTLLAEDGYDWLIIDEISMMDGRQLDIIYQAVKMMNEQRAMNGDKPLGILLTGDFCQLPPIKSKWAFEAECWPFFEAATERLDKVYRQVDQTFLEAINHIRAGRGMAGAAILAKMGVDFVKTVDTKFEGTTIIAKNEAVDNFNWLCHSKIPGVPWTVLSKRWMAKGRREPGEWHNIPLSLALKPNAYVMVLTNDTPDFSYVNGDCGHIIDYHKAPEREWGTFHVELVRTGEQVEIGPITRLVTQREPPDELLLAHPGVGEAELREIPREAGMPYWEPKEGGRGGRWVTGGVTFYPLRLAYASTVHKTQGLSLDKVQIDLNQHFMSAPGMVYVALSRAKSPLGLRIVGSAALLGSRVKTDPAVGKWL